MRLSNPPIFYRNQSGGHVENGPITLRLYNGPGTLANDVRVHCDCMVSVGMVTSEMRSRSDTVAVPAGCVPPLVYWGEGDPEAPEVVSCFAIFNNDTVARAQTSFFVYDPPGP